MKPTKHCYYELYYAYKPEKFYLEFQVTFTFHGIKTNNLQYTVVAQILIKLIQHSAGVVLHEKWFFLFRTFLFEHASMSLIQLRTKNNTWQMNGMWHY